MTYKKYKFIHNIKSNFENSTNLNSHKVLKFVHAHYMYFIEQWGFANEDKSIAFIRFKFVSEICFKI